MWLLCLLALAGPASEAGATLPGASGRIAFVAGGDIWVADAGGGGAANVTNSPARESTPRWSPDGRRIAFTRERSGSVSDVWVMDADGRNQVNLTREVDHNVGPSWSPDGTRIAFSAQRPVRQDPDVYVMDSNGDNVVNLTNAPGADFTPAWSPDGAKIAFVSVREGNAGTAIWAMDFGGGNQRRLTDVQGSASNPSWSPDGARIAFDVRAEDVWTMTADGDDERKLTGSEAIQEAPAWAPDGEKIVFQRRGGSSGGDPDLWTMNPDGSGAASLVEDVAGGAVTPDWQSLPAAMILDSGSPPTASAPYPVVLPVRNLKGHVTRVTVRIGGLYHSGSIDQLDLLLVSPGGRRAMLVSDVGNGHNPARNISLSLSDAAGAALPEEGPVSSGDYRPTDYAREPFGAPTADTFAAPAPGAPYPASLGVFAGGDPNGDWLLYAVDDLVYFGGRIGAVRLEVETAGTAGAAESAPRDMTAPFLSAALSRRRFRAGGPGAALSRRAPAGTAIRYGLSEPARIEVVVERGVPGRRVRGRCLTRARRMRKGRRCTRYRRTGALSVSRGAGGGSIPFSGKVGRRKLGPGTYRARVSAVDRSDNRSAERRLPFVVVKR